jgi:hypothetical protein
MKPSALVSIDTTPHPDASLPFANEVEVQRFVEKHAQRILGLRVIASSLRDGHRLGDIDILDVDPRGTPVIIECKWDLVRHDVLRQLAGYAADLQRNWSSLEKRVNEVKRPALTIKKRKPILVAIGYRYDASLLIPPQSVTCLTYCYHGIAPGDGFVEHRRRGRVSIQRADGRTMSLGRHPRVSKKAETHRRLARLPEELRAAFWKLDRRLCTFEGVTVTYGGKNFVRYRLSRRQFAEAKIGLGSIQWHSCQPGPGRNRYDSVVMLTASDSGRVLRELQRAHRYWLTRPWS